MFLKQPPLHKLDLIQKVYSYVTRPTLLSAAQDFSCGLSPPQRNPSGCRTGAHQFGRQPRLVRAAHDVCRRLVRAHGQRLRSNGKRPSKSRPCIEQIVNDLRQLGRHSAVFDPAKSESTFEILVYDEFNYPVQSVIDRLIRPQAPRMHFNVHTLSYDCLNELVNGTVDFAIVYEGFDDSRPQLRMLCAHL